MFAAAVSACQGGAWHLLVCLPQPGGLLASSQSPAEEHLWVPRTSSTSCDQAIFVVQASGASLSCYAVLLTVDWFG